MARPTTKKETILESAFRLFTDQGIELTTTRQIVAAAGCNEITLFRQFSNKDGLVRAVIEWYVPKMDLPQLHLLKPSGDMENDLYDITKLMLKFHAERESFFKFIFANIVQHPEHRDFILEVQAPFLEWLHHYFADYLAATDLDPETVIHDFITPIAMRTVGWVFLGERQLDPDCFARTHAKMIARAVTSSTAVRPAY